MHTQRQLQRIAQLLGLLLSFAPLTLTAQVVQDPPFGRPDAVVDLASHEGVQLVKAQWRYHDVQIVDAESRSVGHRPEAQREPNH